MLWMEFDNMVIYVAYILIRQIYFWNKGLKNIIPLTNNGKNFKRKPEQINLPNFVQMLNALDL